MHHDPEDIEVGVYLTATYGGPWEGRHPDLAELEVVADYCGVLGLCSDKPGELWDEEELAEWAKEVLRAEKQFREWEILQSIITPGENNYPVDQKILDQGTVLGVDVHRAEILEMGSGAYGDGNLDFADLKMQGAGADEYYAQLDAKHFSPDGTGSIFLQLSNCEQLLRLALLQGGFDDDRRLFSDLGVPAGTMLGDRKYVMVRTPGLDGSCRAGELDPNTIVRTVSTKGDVVDLVASFPRQGTEYATLVMTLDDRLITAFPGLPAAPMNHSLEEGLELRAGDLDPEATVLAAV